MTPSATTSQPGPIGRAPAAAQVVSPEATLADLSPSVVLAHATVHHSLVWARQPQEAREALHRFVEALDGSVVRACEGGPECLPIDVSLGIGEPVLATAPLGTPAHAHLEAHLPGVVASARHVVERMLGDERLLNEVGLDPLTGLPNRRALGRTLARLRRTDVVVVIDLDGFKSCNDRLGHPTGDAVLRAFGRTLGGEVRDVDRCGRFGGDEFVVVLARSTLADADAFLRRLREAWLAERHQPLTFSAGIAVGVEPADALPAADRALYEAKRGGRDRWEVASPEPQP